MCEQIRFIDYKSKIIYPEMIEGVKPLNEKIYQTKEGKLIKAYEHKPEYLRLSQAERERMEKEHVAK